MKILVAFVLMISCAVTANLLMKLGASEQAVPQGFLAKVLYWRVLLGVAFFATAEVIYVLILTWLPLNMAQSFAAAQFAAVILAARFFLGEPIAVMQWIGIVLIAAGIGGVGWSCLPGNPWSGNTRPSSRDGWRTSEGWQQHQELPRAQQQL